MLGLIIVVLIGYFLFRNKSSIHLKNTKEDTVSQWFLFLSVIFLGVTLFGFNRDLGNPLSWRVIVLMTTICGGLSAYYFKLPVTLAASLIGFMGWWISQIAVWIESASLKPTIGLVLFSLLALNFYVTGYIHEQSNKRKVFSKMYVVLGLISITGVLFGLSTHPGLESLEIMTKGESFVTSWQIVTSLTLSIVTLLALVIYSAYQKLLHVPEAIVVVLLVLLVGSINLISGQQISQVGELTPTGIIWAIVFNFAVFVELLAIIFSGYLRKDPWLVNLGTLFIFMLIITKYFDWFFTFLDKSIFFVGAGILLFGIGWFMEKGRRLVVSNLTKEVQV